MINIVDRLRVPSAQGVVAVTQLLSVAHDAADEIEKLRLALHTIWLHGGTAETYDPYVEKICRDMLEDKA